METEIIGVELPYDCWKLILNCLREDLKKDTWKYWRLADNLDIWLVIIRSISRSSRYIISKYQREHDLLIGFSKGAVNEYFSAKGFLSCLKYATIDLKYHIGTDTAEEAVTGGHFECLKFIAETNPKICWSNVIEKAAKGGNYDCLVYCHQYGISFNMLEDSAASGNLEMVKYIRPHFKSEYTNRYTLQAAKNGHLKILQYAVEIGDGLDTNTCIAASESDSSYECLVYAHQNGIKLEERCLRGALTPRAYKCALYLLANFRLDPGFVVFKYHEVPFGNLEILEALHRQGVKWGSDTLFSVIKGGDLECLRYVLQLGVKSSYRSCYSAAIMHNNWRDYFKLLEEYNHPYLGREYETSAEYGNVDCMAYLHENRKLPWPETLTIDIAINGNYNCFVYAHEHGCPWHEYTCVVASKRSDPKLLMYAHEHGATWDYNTTFSAASLGHLEHLKYAHENGCEWNQRTIREADLRGHKKCVEYMQSQDLKLINTYSWDSTECVEK
jgi:hypothetical protein